MVLCVSEFPAARLEQQQPSPPPHPLPKPSPPRPLLRHYIALPMSSPPTSRPPAFPLDTPRLSRPPNSRVLMSPAKPGDPAPTMNTISLRYQPMTAVDPAPPLRKIALDPPMASSRHKSPPGRSFRPKPSPGRRPMLEAIPNSWASASRPSDLRPNPPPLQTSRAPRPSPTPPPPTPTLPARPNTVRLRSKSADRVATKTSVGGPRSPKRGALVQPTPKRLSLGMVMDTAKLVSTPPAPSDLGSSVSVPLSKPIVPLPATNTVPIRSLPTSPNGSPCIVRLPISGSHYKHDLSPSPVSPVHRSTSPASLPALGPKPLPVPPLPSLQPPVPPSPHRPLLHLNPTVPLSPFTPSLPSSWSPKSPLQNSSASPSTATTTATTSSYASALSDDLSKHDESSQVKQDRSGDSPASIWSSGYFTSPLSQQNDRTRDGHHESQVQDTHASDKSAETTTQPLPSLPPHPPPSLPIEEVEEEEEEEERRDRLDNLDAYDWTLEEELYDDQLFRIPISPTASPGSGLKGSDGPLLEVFVDNVYCGEPDRSPSPITYARPAGSESSDEESNVGRRRKVRRRANVKQEGEQTSPTRVNYTDFGAIASQTNVTGNRRHSRRSGLSSPISYHSDDSSLYFNGNRPLPSRRRREQLRSYRYSFRPPVTPAAAAAATAVSLNTLAGGGKGLAMALECQRSPSPIEYARRRSLDGLYGFDSEDEMDEGDGDVVFAHPQHEEEGGGDGLVSGWWETRDVNANALGFLIGGGGGMKRRMVQPRSFMHVYSKPPDVTSFSEERERVLEREKEVKERGRREERTLIPMPLVSYNSNHDQNHNHKTQSNTQGHGNNNNNNNNNKERSKDNKEKSRTRKGSRGFLDELAAVAVRNNHSTRKTNNQNNNCNNTPRTSGGSPPPSLPPLPPLPFHSKDKDRDEKDKEKEKEKEKKRRWVWELNKSDGLSKDKLVACAGGVVNGSSSSLAGSSGENVLVLDIGNVNGGGGEGYEGWNAEWLDEDLVGRNRRGRKQRHSLNGLEFV